MPNSLKVKLSKLRYKGQITNDEYKELMIKLDGHNKQLEKNIYNQALNDFAYKMNKILAETDLRDNGYYVENLVSMVKNELKNR